MVVDTTSCTTSHENIPLLDLPVVLACQLSAHQAINRVCTGDRADRVRNPPSMAVGRSMCNRVAGDRAVATIQTLRVLIDSLENVSASRHEGLHNYAAQHLSVHT